MAHHSENMEAGTKPVKSTGQCVFRVFPTFWRFPCFFCLCAGFVSLFIMKKVATHSFVLIDRPLVVKINCVFNQLFSKCEMIFLLFVFAAPQ